MKIKFETYIDAALPNELRLDGQTYEIRQPTFNEYVRFTKYAETLSESSLAEFLPRLSDFTGLPLALLEALTFCEISALISFLTRAPKIKRSEKKKKKKSEGTAEVDLMDIVAEFERVFPGLFNGGEIGWWYFWEAYNRIIQLRAKERAQMMYAALYGNLLDSDKNNRLRKQMLQETMKEAQMINHVSDEEAEWLKLTAQGRRNYE